MALKDVNEMFKDELQDPAFAMGYLQTSLEEEGLSGLLYALKKVAKAHNITCYKTPEMAKEMTDLELVQFVDATPDDDYVLRILRRARLYNLGLKWREEGDISEGKKKIYGLMNEAQDKRAAMLQKAISVLEDCKRRNG